MAHRPHCIFFIAHWLLLNSSCLTLYVSHFVLGFPGRTDSWSLPRAVKTWEPGKSSKSSASATAPSGSHWPRFRIGWRERAGWFPSGGRKGKRKKAHYSGHETPVGATSQGQKLVHGCNFQASAEAIYTAVKHQRVCEVRTVCQTGSLSVCFDVGEKKEWLQKGTPVFLFIFYYVRDIIWDSYSLEIIFTCLILRFSF